MQPPQTLRFQNCHQPQIYCDLGLDLRLRHPPGLPEWNCSACPFRKPSISLPRPDDELWIITDGAVKTPGIGATLYVTRNNKLQLAGFFSAKPRGRQVTWLPCKIEALSIAAVTNHFSPYIFQSKTAACILTDSKPCVQPFEKLCRDEFSSSPRVATFLSIVTRYQASVRHVSGAAILPSDFASRNAPE